MPRIVIVGAGVAGGTTAEALRRLGYSGEITLIGDEEHEPYDRPPLSKTALTGDDLPHVTVFSRSYLAGLDIELRTATSAAGIDTSRRRIALATGEELRYDQAVLATGVSARAPVWREGCSIHTLRSLRDAIQLREQLRRCASVAVVGGGLLAYELAASARLLGIEVVVIDRARAPLAAVLGDLASRMVVDLHRSRGTDIRTAARVQAIRSRNGKQQLKLADLHTIEVDLVIAATGSTPNVGWLRDSRLELNNGILCDRFGRAAPHVYCVGDIARWHDPARTQPLKRENRTNAVEQAAAVADLIASGLPTQVPDRYFWSDQYGIRIQVAGEIPRGATLTLLDGSPAENRFVLSASHNGITTGILGWGMPSAFTTRRNEFDGLRATHS